MPDEGLVRLRAALEVEMRSRKLAFSVGLIGEGLVLEYFNSTPRLPKLQMAPNGTKNVDALSRNGDRYSIKTLCHAKKTGTIYPDPDDREKQLFEYLVIARLKPTWELRSLHRLSWGQFVEFRSWDKRMNAWYVGCSSKVICAAEACYDSGEKKLS